MGYGLASSDSGQGSWYVLTWYSNETSRYEKDEGFLAAWNYEIWLEIVGCGVSYRTAGILVDRLFFCRQ
jgi:hypothetical protein